MPHPQCLDDAQCRLPVGGREPRVPAGSCREGAEQRRQLGRHGRAAQRRLQRAIHLDGAQKCEGRRQKCGGREHADCRYRLCFVLPLLSLAVLQCDPVAPVLQCLPDDG